MELSISVCARDRQFSKAMHRIHSRLAPLLRAFSQANLTNPIHRAILVGVTDEKGPEFFEEVPNGGEYFQVLAGIQASCSDLVLTKAVFDICRRAAIMCPFSIPDKQLIQSVFDRTELAVIGE